MELKERMALLCSQWHTLLCQINRECRFDYALFKTTYRDTLKILRHLSCEAAVPKVYMELFCAADAFATHFVTGISAAHDAAGELTGRMLYFCCMTENNKMIDTWTDNDGQVYAFADVDASVTALAKQYEADYT